MKPKELQQKLGITAERIKLFKREGIFIPENPPVGSRSTNYTETDYNNLKLIIVLTKSGLTCSDIRKLQNGEYTLEEAIITRRLYIEDDMARKRNSLTLLTEILDDNEAFEDFHIDHYWDIISKREAEGEEFIDVVDMYDYHPVSLIRTVHCPYCGKELEVDLDDFETGQNSDDRNNEMGLDITYEFDSEDNVECPSCQMKYRVSGWIREYPVGAYDSESIVVNKEIEV